MVALVTFTAMLGGGIIAPLLPRYATEMGASALMLGVIVAGYAASKALLMPIIGRYSDRLGRKKFLIVGMALFSVISLGYIWAGEVWHLILVRVLHGAAGGMIVPVARAIVGDFAPRGQEGRWMGYFNASFISGMGCGPLLGGLMSDHVSVAAAFLTMGGLGLCGLAATIFLMPPDDTSVHLGRQRGSLREMTRSPIIRAVFATRITENIGRKAFSAFLPLFGGVMLGLSATQIGLLMFINVGASTLTTVFVGRITDIVNKKTMIITTSLLAMIYMALIPQLTAFWMLAVLVVFNGSRAALNNTSSSALMVMEGRKYGMATSMATFSLAVAIGEGVGPLIAGAIVDATNYGAAFYVASGAFLSSVILFSWFTRPRHGVSPDLDGKPVSG